jgi:phage protein
MKDITNEWKKVSPENAKEVRDLAEYEINGVIYKVDGEHIVLDYSQYEKDVATILAHKYGREVSMIPRINYPQGIPTADCLIDGMKYDLKTPRGNGKNTLYGMVKSKRRQANRFIIDIDMTELPMEEIFRQNKDIFYSKHTNYVQEILYIKDKEIIRAYKR